MKHLKHVLSFSALAILCMSSCHKKKVDQHIPPDVEFKTGTGYTFSDKTVKKSDTLLIGITATKTEDDLKSYNASFTYDSGSTSTTFFNYLLTVDEANAFSKDIKIIARNQAGSEKWVFSIVDRDGNITQKTIVLTVQ